MVNGIGVVCDSDREFRIFDLLPEWLRRRLANADDNWSSEDVARLYSRMRHAGNSEPYIEYEMNRLLPVCGFGGVK